MDELQRRKTIETVGKRAIAVLGLVLTTSWAGYSADAPIIRQGVTETGGFVGASYGVDKARVMGGGNIVYSLTKVFMPYGEVSYFPGIVRSYSATGATYTADIPLTDLNFGFHLRVPIPKSRVIPYGVIGFGLLHAGSGTETETRILPGVSQPKITPGLPRPASTDYTTSFGGGLRYYATERWGFRVEAKGYKPQGVYKDVFYRVTGGFFYQF